MDAASKVLDVCVPTHTRMGGGILHKPALYGTLSPCRVPPFLAATCYCVFMQVACGFSDGTTLLLQGDLARSPLLPPPAPLLIQPGEDNPSAVTALHFSKGHAAGKGGSSAGQVRRCLCLSVPCLALRWMWAWLWASSCRFPSPRFSRARSPRNAGKQCSRVAVSQP